MYTFLLDIILIVLLTATIVCCFILNRRIKRLHGEENKMTTLIKEFDATAHSAAPTLETSRQESEKIERNLRQRIREARAVSDELQILVGTVPPHTKPKTSRPKAGWTKTSTPETRKTTPPFASTERNDPAKASVRSHAERELLKALKSET